MGFGDLKSDAGLKSLDDYLSDKSYVEGLVNCLIHAQLIAHDLYCPLSDMYPLKVMWPSLVP